MKYFRNFLLFTTEKCILYLSFEISNQYLKLILECPCTYWDYYLFVISWEVEEKDEECDKTVLLSKSMYNTIIHQCPIVFLLNIETNNERDIFLNLHKLEVMQVWKVGFPDAFRMLGDFETKRKILRTLIEKNVQCVCTTIWKYIARISIFYCRILEYNIL